MTTSGNSAETGDSESRSRGKVAKLIYQYGFIGISEELEEYWTRETNDRMSLRELADFFNKSLLDRILQQEGAQTIDGEVANYYRLLTDDDVSSGTQIQAENQLEQNGVDVEQLKTNFVSRQAIHTFLTTEREATYKQPDSSDEERLDARIETIRRLKNRLITIAEQTLSELGHSNQLSSSETHVTVLVQVHCINCDTQYPITEYLQSGGCDCRSTD